MSFQANRPSDNSPSPRRHSPLLIVLLVLALLFVITYAGRLTEYRRLLKVEASMQEQIEDAKGHGRELAADLARVKSPEYTEEIAITEMGLGQEGTQVLTVIDPSDKTVQAQDPAAAPSNDTEGGNAAEDRADHIRHCSTGVAFVAIDLQARGRIGR